MTKKIRKRLIEPKVRLLLWIYLYGVKDESNYLAKLADKIDYSEGSIKSHLEDLLDKKFIVSLNSDRVSPPYKVAEDGKRFLKPILFVTRIGIAVTAWNALWALIFYYLYTNQPVLVLVSWFPLLLVSFAVFSIVLLFYPYIIVKFGKISY